MCGNVDEIWPFVSYQEKPMYTFIFLGLNCMNFSTDWVIRDSLGNPYQGRSYEWQRMEELIWCTVLLFYFYWSPRIKFLAPSLIWAYTQTHTLSEGLNLGEWKQTQQSAVLGHGGTSIIWIWTWVYMNYSFSWQARPRNGVCSFDSSGTRNGGKFSSFWAVRASWAQLGT